MRKLVAEGERVQKDGTTWAGQKKRSVEAVTRKKARRSTGCTMCPSWREVRNQISEGLAKGEQRANKPKEEW